MKSFLGTLCLSFILCNSISSCEQVYEQEGARIELLNNCWKLETSKNVWSELNQNVSEKELAIYSNIEQGFSIRCKLHLSIPTFDRHILKISDVLDVCLRQHNPLDRSRQNYPAYKMKEGNVPVLEAGLTLKSPIDGHEEKMVIGFPLAMLDRPLGEHELVLNFSGAQWTMFIDGKLMDNDFPIGYPIAEKMKKWEIDTTFISSAKLFYPAIQPKRITGIEKEIKPQIQYWTPNGHNTWVGDVVSLYYKKRYHLFYLYDRRGHQSKFGKGGHYFEHISTSDFRHWTEHEAAVPIEEQWETFGTGTPFVWENKLYLSYGYHTTRIYPYEQTTLPTMHKYLNKNGHTNTFQRHNISEVAAGSSYSVSSDGIHFQKTGILFHPCENPSIYIDPRGKLKMLANYGSKGTWTSDSVAGGWHCINENFPLGGDCTFFFHWGNYDYIIGGFTHLWSKQTTLPDSTYQDLVADGLDFYNGMSVPTITEIPNGRFLMAGWLWMKAWGGALVIHELTQQSNGRIGTKWMEALLPIIGQQQTISTHKEFIDNLPSSSFLLTFEVIPQSKDYRIGVSLLPSTEKGWQDACEWRIDGTKHRAQYAGINNLNWANQELSLREGGAPQQCRNYAIENLIDTDKPFKVRMIIKNTEKFDGTLIDTEIAGKRTMISYREKLTINRLRFYTEHVSLQNIKIAPLAE